MKDYDFKEINLSLKTVNCATIKVYSLQPSKNGPNVTLKINDISGNSYVDMRLEEAEKLRDLLNKAIEMNKEVYELD